MTSKKRFHPSPWSPRSVEIEASSAHESKCKHSIRSDFDELVCIYCGVRWYPNPYGKCPKWITATTDNRDIPERHRIVEKRGRPGYVKPNKDC